jgi:hypothetical protein
MSLLNLKKFGFMAAGVGLFAIVAAQGCSSDDPQATPSGGTGGKSNTAGSAGSKSGGAANKAGAENNGGSAGVPPDEETAGSDGDGDGGEGGAAPIDPGCIGDDGCYSCPPKTNSQFLNACVEGGCPANFDNSKLTKLGLVGTL